MERQLVSIQRIIDIQPIPDADRIVRATVLGWQVIVKKEDFKVGDLCVFFEIDSVIPFNPWNAFLAKSNTQTTIRLRTVKMKGQMSQGLAMPVSAIPRVREFLGGTAMELPSCEGTDLTAFLGVTKYEPHLKQHSPLAVGGRPHWVAKTDETRIQSVPWVIDYFKHKEVYITQKLDGSSISVAKHPVEGDVICSRNMNLKMEIENNFTREGKKILEKMPAGFLIQGELVGPGIQNNRLGLTDHAVFIFNIYDLAVPGGKLLSYTEMFHFCEKYNLTLVPVVAVGSFTYETVDELLTLAQVGTYANGHPQEGVVIRPVIPENHHKLGMLSFKVISNEFLLKTGA